MKNTLSKEIRETLIKNFMKMLILLQLEKAPMGGYDVIKFFYENYNILFSSGTIYSCLYAMERNGLVTGLSSQRKRIYKITEKGRTLLNVFRKDKEELLKFISDVLEHCSFT